MIDSLKPDQFLRAKSCLLALVVFAALAIASCTKGNARITSYGNVHFDGYGTCDRMSISPGPPPKNIAITLSDGRKLPLPSMTRDEVVAMFGEPKLVGQIDKGKTKYEKFGDGGCDVTFENGEFDGLWVRERSTITNLDNNKSITLPATEAEIRKVFGKPTEISYPRSQQP
jgi:hypothetical protein